LLANPPDQATRELTAPLRERPERAAILCDIDGTLAPIARAPELAAVPPRARELLTELGRHFAVVACVSGRQAAEARKLVGVGSIAYIGNHGLEYLPPGAQAPQTPSAFDEHAETVRAFTRSAFDDELRTLGVRLEDKQAIWSFHWRGVPDDPAAQTALEDVAARAAGVGLRPHWGRKVLEIRPALSFDKGMAVAGVLTDAHVRSALYVGDDRTDLDAFRALRQLHEEGALEHAVCVGVRSAEGPPEMASEADLEVDGPAGVLALLELLAQTEGAGIRTGRPRTDD
jgi:trehalose 6-phosphate phosphatase